MKSHVLNSGHLIAFLIGFVLAVITLFLTVGSNWSLSANVLDAVPLDAVETEYDKILNEDGTVMSIQ